MRIIAGQWRGRTIASPSGDVTRPTTDRVRESLMSSLASARGGFEGACVLDGFAGSGALGLETLSRGARMAVFCERDTKALSVLNANINTFKLDTSVARICRGDVLIHPPIIKTCPFDLVLLDPPYAIDPSKIAALLKKLNDASALDSDVVVTYEHDRSTDIMPSIVTGFGPIELIKHKEAGKIAFDIFRKAR